MIPTHDMLIGLWQQVAANADWPEPHCIAVPAPNDGVYTAAFMDDSEHETYIKAAYHLYSTNDLGRPEWIAAMHPCHWIVSDNPEAEAGDAAEAFAAGNPDAHESVGVTLVTQDRPPITVMYDQPLLEPSTEPMEGVGGHLTDILTSILARMNV